MNKKHLLFILYLIFSFQVFAQPGELDDTFGKNGKKILNTSISEAYFNDIVLTKDGVIGVGSIGTVDNQCFLAKIRHEGVVDKSFDISANNITNTSNYKGSVQIGTENYRTNEVFKKSIIDSEGEMWSVGTKDSTGILARMILNSDSSSWFIDDLSENVDGTLFWNESNVNVNFQEILTLSTNFKLVAGITKINNKYMPCVYRFTDEGVLDESFGAKGKLLLSNFNAYEHSKIKGVNLNSDAALFAFDCEVAGKQVVRWFELIDGRINTQSPFTNYSFPILGDSVRLGDIQRSSKGFIFLGLNHKNRNNQISVTINKYTSLCVLDRTFNLTGSITQLYSDNTKLVSFAINKSDQVIMAFNKPNSLESFVSQLSANGILNTTFGLSKGIMPVFANGYDSEIATLKLDQSDRIYLAGHILNDKKIDGIIFKEPVVFKLTKSGIGYQSVNSDSIWFSNNSEFLKPNMTEKYYDMQIDTKGRALIASIIYLGNFKIGTVTRLNKNGEYDNSFSVGEADLGGTKLIFVPGLLTDDSFIKINKMYSFEDNLLIGFLSGNKEYYSSKLFVRKLNNDGLNDISWGEKGNCEIAFSENEVGEIIDINQSKDGFLVLILVNRLNQKSVYRVCKLTSNGKIDLQYGTNGFFELAIDKQYIPMELGGAGFNEHTGVLMKTLSDTIVVAASIDDLQNYNPSIVLAKILINGKPDLSFSSTGCKSIPITTDKENNGSVTSIIANNSTNTFLVSVYGDYLTNTTVYKFNSNGVLDKNFISNKKFINKFGKNSNYASDLAVQSNGQLLIGTSDLQTATCYLSRLDTIGYDLDTLFNNGVPLRIDAGNLEEIITWNNELVYTIVSTPDRNVAVSRFILKRYDQEILQDTILDFVFGAEKPAITGISTALLDLEFLYFASQIYSETVDNTTLVIPLKPTVVTLELLQSGNERFNPVSKTIKFTVKEPNLDISGPTLINPGKVYKYTISGHQKFFTYNWTCSESNAQLNQNDTICLINFNRFFKSGKVICTINAYGRFYKKFEVDVNSTESNGYSQNLNKLTDCFTEETADCSELLISSIKFNNIVYANNQCNGRGYTDLTNSVFYTKVNKTSSHELITTMEAPAGTEKAYLGIWVDYNNNGSFADVGEFVGGGLSNSTSFSKINISFSGISDTVNVARIRIRYSTFPFKIGDYCILKNDYADTKDFLVVFEENKVLKIPNLITPNNDGVNDIFEIQGIDYSTNKNRNLVIYNTLGTILYENNKYNNNWDGKWNGQNLESGTYYYLFENGTNVENGFFEIRY